MENQVNSKKIVLNYGLFYGLTSISLSLLSYTLGKHLDQGKIASLIGFAIMISFIISGIKKFKSLNNGFISWSQSVKIGVGIIVIGITLTIIYQQIFMNFIEPDFVNQLTEKVHQSLLDSGLSEEQAEAQLEMQRKFQTPAISIPLGIVVGAFFGFIISAIAGAIMKKTEENEY